MQTSGVLRLFTLRNLFLYIVVIVLPILVAYFALANMVDEQYLARREVLKQELDLQSASADHISTPKYQIRDFFQTLLAEKKLVRQNPEAIARLITRLDELYPGGFKWLFWDEKGSIIPVKSKLILNGQRSWEFILRSMMVKSNMISNPGALTENYTFQKQFATAMGTIQKAMGGLTKVEHLNWARNEPSPMSWLSKPCLALWDVDVVSYQRENIPAQIRGGCLLMVFQEKLSENLWQKRMVLRRSRSVDRLKFPVAAINISEKTTLAIDPELPCDKGFAAQLMDAYVNRSQNVFDFRNYLVRSGRPDVDSQMRLLSFADLSKPRQNRQEMLNALLFACLLLLTITGLVAVFIDKSHFAGVSLRRRIAAIFMIAILMPILSMVSIGKTFVVHEEARLKESAFVKMRAGIEALDLRYKDTPRLMEQQLFKDLLKLIGKPPYDFDKVQAAMNKANEAELIEHFVLTDVKGKVVRTNWKELDVAIRKMLEMASAKMIKFESGIADAPNSVLQDAVNEEVDEMMQTLGTTLDFSRPSHLRYFAYVDQQMYFMSINVLIDGMPNPLFVHLPDHYLERNFANREFALNRLASEQTENNNSTARPELSFYSTFEAVSSIPVESDIWQQLDDSFKRSFGLKVEEHGQVKIGDENFLYLIKPLTSMYRQSFVPCLLTSTRLIEDRLRTASIVVAGLAFTALLGAVLLSLVLASSLLVPISKIDSAAQQVGMGNLTIALPDMGTDELGRLSQTFNDMVRGLREREKMQAYVSDSVLEAVQDSADASIHAGRNLEATILFSDIRNFTGLTEENSPDKIFAVLNEFLGGVEPIIRANHGRVDKFIGDAVMAVFLQTSPEHHALSAVKAGVQMKRFLKKLNQSRSDLGMFTINIGVGISTGTVLLGDVGSSRRKDLTVIGDEVNLASRLEAASKKGRHSKIIFSGATYNLIKDYVEAEEMPFTEIRGKQQAVNIYELIRLKNE